MAGPSSSRSRNSPSTSPVEPYNPEFPGPRRCYQHRPGESSSNVNQYALSVMPSRYSGGPSTSAPPSQRRDLLYVIGDGRNSPSDDNSYDVSCVNN